MKIFCETCKGTGMLSEFEVIPEERICEPIQCPRCNGHGEESAIAIETLRPLIRAIGVVMGCHFDTIEPYELSALKKMNDEAKAVAHLIYESTK